MKTIAILRCFLGACLLVTAPFLSAQEIALLPKGSQTIFWQLYIAGAQKAADEAGVTLSERSPANESQVEAQLKMFEFFIGKGVDAIVLTPLDKDQLAPAVEAAIGKGVAVVVTDSALSSDMPASFIASDNRAAGRSGALAMAETLGSSARGKVLNLRYLKGSASTDAREDGVYETLREKLPNVEVVNDVWGGVVLGDVKRAVDEQLAAHPDLVGIVTTNTVSTLGAYKSLKASGKAGSIPLWGSGVTDELLEGLRSGEISGLYVQNPYEMGYLGVKTAVAVLRGEAVDKQVRTEVALLTKENLDDPDKQKLIRP